MRTFQQLIRAAEESSEGEADRSMDLRLEIRTHGKPVHLWKLALRLQRFIHVSFGDTTIFMTMGNEELVDDFTDDDDDGEYWHSLNWKEEGGVEVEPTPPADPEATLTAAQKRHQELLAQRGQH